MDQKVGKPLTLNENDGNKIMISLLSMFYTKNLSNNLCDPDNKAKSYLIIKKEKFNMNYIANKDQANLKKVLEFSMAYDPRDPKPNFLQLLCLIELTVVHVFENCPDETIDDLFLIIDRLWRYYQRWHYWY